MKNLNHLAFDWDAFLRRHRPFRRKTHKISNRKNTGLFLFYVLYGLCFSLFAHSHTRSQSYNGDRIELIEDIYEKAIALSPEVLSLAQVPLSSQAYVKVGGQYVPLNPEFYKLIRSWIRLYRSELEQYCPCDISEDELVKSARDHIAKGFFSSKVGEPVTHFLENTAKSAVEISSKYGKVAGALKVSAEVAEHSLSVFVGGKGVSVLCNVIDVMIFFLFRKTQMYARVFSNAKTLNQSKLLMMFRLYWLNRLMKTAQEKVFFHLETAEINQAGLELISREGAGKKNQRAKWLNKISQTVGPLLNQIKVLDTELEQEFLSKRQKRKLLKKRQKLYEKIKRVTAVYGKSFFGKRYKRFLLLQSRKGNPGHLKGLSFADTATTEKWLWPLSIQENVLERALIQEAEREVSRAQDGAPLPKDEIRNGLAREFAQKMQIQKDKEEHIRHIERILMDIENIFNPSLTVKERYLSASIVEAGLTGFFKYYLNLLSSRISQSTADMGAFGRIRLYGKVRGRFEYYVLAYSDFLRTTALTKNKKAIAPYKYSAMESFLLFFEYLNQLSRITRSNNTKQELWIKMNQNLKRIEVFQIQREKRTAYSWIPFRSPLPYCRNLLGVSI